MRKILIVTALLLFSMLQIQAQPLPEATDISAIDIDSFIDNLPKDRISDRAIRVVDLGGYNAGIFAAFRPQSQPGRALRHDTPVSEIYYMLSGTGTLVTGGRLENEENNGNSRLTGRPNYAGTGIIGGVSRTVVPGDVIVIPGNTPHWWSSLDTDIRYLIFRPDPESLLELR